MNGYVWISGESDENPGPAGIGVLIKGEHGEVLSYVSEYLGRLTRSAAEYQALIAALTEAKRLRLENLVVYTDSMFVRQQLQGLLKNRAKHLEPLVFMVKQLMRTFQGVELVAIDRNQNQEAERLALNAIQSARSARKPTPK